MNRIDRRLVLSSAGRETSSISIIHGGKTVSGNSYITSEGDLVLDGVAVEFAEPVLMAA